MSHVKKRFRQLCQEARSDVVLQESSCHKARVEVSHSFLLRIADRGQPVLRRAAAQECRHLTHNVQSPMTSSRTVLCTRCVRYLCLHSLVKSVLFRTIPHGSSVPRVSYVSPVGLVAWRRAAWTLPLQPWKGAARCACEWVWDGVGCVHVDCCAEPLVLSRKSH